LQAPNRQRGVSPAMHELNKGLVVGGCKVADVIGLVEKELLRWQCGRYTHITRALEATDYATDHGIIHLQTIFSKPVQEQPVPIAVVCVYFHYDTQRQRLTYQFEQESVLHTVGGQSLADGKFEGWIDRIIGDKLQVRQLHDLATPFESTRLKPPSEHTAFPGVPAAAPEEAESAPGEDEIDVSEMYPVAMGAAGLTGTGKESLPLGTLLVNIFDAADEENEWELTHKEVADLLYATPLGLADWDIKLLLTSATELDSGRIQWQPFVEQAPEIIDALLRRRADYEAKKQSNVQVIPEAVELCYGEEIAEVARAAGEAFSQLDGGGKGTLTRNEFRQCLLTRAERFSMMEVQMLMQMCTEDDFGQVPYDEFNILLTQLRIDALHNALVETEVANLRVHLILLSRREGMMDTVVPIWDLRNLLLNADQLCLSRMQIHVILMIVHPDEYGDVDYEYFLRVCCTVIPQMFDKAAIKEKAEMIAKEKADLQAKQELEELQGITGGLATKTRRSDEEDQEDVQANAPDRDAVEKALIGLGHQADEKHRAQPSLEVRKFLEAMRHETVQAQQLSDAELRGFIAEAEIDNQEIAYVDHIKTWVPILFELRRSRVYDGILSKDWGFDAPNLISLTEYEADFPLREPSERGDAESRDGSRPSSAASSRRGGGAGRRPSSAARRPTSAARGRTPTGNGRTDALKRKNSLKGTSVGSRPGSRGSGRGRLVRANSERSDSSVDSRASRRSGGGVNRPESRGSGPSSRVR